MFDQSLQNRLSQLDLAVKKSKKSYRYKMMTLGFVLTVPIFGGFWAYQQPIPEVSVDHLARMVIIASRTSDNDPIRLLGDVERHMGKKIQNLSKVERADALNFLMSHIDLHHNREELISY
jgi:hypothetical protein